MVRIKNRWMLVEFLNPELNEALVPFSASKIYHAIKDSAIHNFGDAGWGTIGVSLSVKYYSTTTNLCIIRVGRDHLPVARAAVTLLTAIEAKPVIPVVHHCSGTIKKTQQAAIEYNRVVVARFRSRTYNTDSRVNNIGSLDDYLEASTKEIEQLQD